MLSKVVHFFIRQILRSGWKSRLLPPRDVRIFITDRKKDSTIWLRPLKEDKRAANGELEQEADLGLNCRHVSVHNIMQAQQHVQRKIAQTALNTDIDNGTYGINPAIACTEEKT